MSMTGKKVLRRMITTLALCLCTTVAHGEDVRLFVMGGGSSLFNQNTFTQNSQSWRSDYATGGKLIVGGEVPLNKIIAIEAAYSFGHNNPRITNLTASPNTMTGYDVDNRRVSGDLVVHAPKSTLGLRPYLVAGLEYDRFSPTSVGMSAASTSGFAGTPDVTLTADNKFGFNYGGGIEWKMARILGLRFDVRDHLTGSPHFGLASMATATEPAVFPVSGIAHGLEYSAGLVFRLGK